MISAVDTNVLFDVLIPGAPASDASEELLLESSRLGAVVLSEPVYAELSAFFPTADELDEMLRRTGIRLEPSTPVVLHHAGAAWRSYRSRRPSGLACAVCGHREPVQCARCGRELSGRLHVVADFMIGAHALVHADRLLTRDRGYYATYFPTLRLAP